MKKLARLQFDSEIAVRILADALMINIALFCASAIGCFSMVDLQGKVTALQGEITALQSEMAALAPIARMAASLYGRATWLLTPINLIVAYANGLYTQGRAYQDRYKILVAARAVSLSYLIYGFLAFFSPQKVECPRSTLLLAWLLSLVFVVGARGASILWYALVLKENVPTSAGETDSDIQSVLVIGGAGYIGSALTEKLLELGYRVRVLDCLLYGDRAVEGMRHHANFELVQADFRNIDAVVRAARGMDAIVHLGAIVGDPACAIDQELTIEINLRATRAIAEVGKGFGVRRFVFASTCSVYGASDEILDERSVLAPISLYARTKVESESVLLSLADAGFSPTILRFATIYGMSPRPRFDLVVNLLTAKAIQEGQAGIFGGQQWRPLVHVQDVAKAIVQCLQAPLYNVRGQVFNVGCNEQNYQIADLGAIIQEMVPTANVVHQPQEDNRNYRVCFDKISHMLNFHPDHSVRDGIQEIIDAYERGQVRDYRDPCCSNVAFLKQEGPIGRLRTEHREQWDWMKAPAETFTGEPPRQPMPALKQPV